MIPTAERVLHVWQGISVSRDFKQSRDRFNALTNNCILPFISSFFQVSMGDRGQWIRGNFSFNGKYPECSSLKGRWQPRGLTLLQCPPVPALSQPLEGSALGRGSWVLRDGWTDGRTDRQVVLGLCTSRCSPVCVPWPRPRCHQRGQGQFQPARARWGRAEPCGDGGCHSILSTGGCCVLRLPSLPGAGGPAVSLGVPMGVCVSPCAPVTKGCAQDLSLGWKFLVQLLSKQLLPMQGPAVG